MTNCQEFITTPEIKEKMAELEAEYVKRKRELIAQATAVPESNLELIQRILEHERIAIFYAVAKVACEA